MKFPLINILKFRIRIVLFLTLISCSTNAQQAKTVIPLWKNGPPGFEAKSKEAESAKDYWVKNIHNPSLQVFLPPAGKANGTAVVVCPGGGFRLLVYNAEGTEPAEYLAKLGITV